MIWFLLLTAFTVSIDSLFCGFSLCFNKNKKLPVIITISLIVFAMCLTTNYLAYLIPTKHNTKASLLGGCLLIGIGVYNIFTSKNTLPKVGKVFKQSILIGFAVGIDGALANLSLALMKINYFFVPLIIAIMHGFMIWIGTILSQSFLVEKLKKYDIIPPLILMLLGVYKIICLFI